MRNQKEKFPEFSLFRTHVESILTSRDQIRANYDFLEQNYRSAGVLFALLVPYRLTNGGLSSDQNLLDHIFLLFEKRSSNLSKHPGQIAFPGGTWEEQDENLIQTALREAEEEVGIQPDQPIFIAYLDEFVSSSRILVKPVVSWLIHDIHENEFAEKTQRLYRPRTKESDDTLIVPLSHLLNPENYQSKPYHLDGVHVGWIRYFDVNDYLANDHVWGLTASMLRRFINNVFPDNLLPDEPIPSKSN